MIRRRIVLRSAIFYWSNEKAVPLDVLSKLIDYGFDLSELEKKYGC